MFMNVRVALIHYHILHYTKCVQDLNIIYCSRFYEPNGERDDGRSDLLIQIILHYCRKIIEFLDWLIKY